MINQHITLWGILKKKKLMYSLLFLITSLLSYSQPPIGKLKIKFTTTVNNESIILKDKVYQNPFGEDYTVNKLKYYVGNCSLSGNVIKKSKHNYFLVDASAQNNCLTIEAPVGEYNNLGFTLGVDSIDNCSGAQTDALDPINDMFWTWNSGYVFLKLEGSSPASTADLQRIQYHIGGYKGANNAASVIQLSPTDQSMIAIKKNTTTEIEVVLHLDNFWNNPHAIKINETPVCMLPGALAKKIASNFNGLFSIKHISYLEEDKH